MDLLSGFHPKLKFIYLIICFLDLMLASSYIHLFLISIILTIYYLFFLDLKKNPSYKLQKIIRLIIFASLIFAFNLIIQRMSGENSGDLSSSLSLSLRVYATFFLFEVFARMDMGEMMYVFSSFPKFSLVISMTVRFIRDLPIKVKSIREARKALGISQGLKENNKRKNKPSIRLEKTIVKEKQNIKDLKIVFSAIFFSYIDASIQVSQSMLARFFGEKDRKTYKKYHLKKGDLIFFAILMALILLSMLTFGFLKSNDISGNLSPMAIVLIENISIFIFILPIFFLKIKLFNRSKHGLY